MKATHDDRQKLGSARVLVAEDERIVALDLQRTFSDAGAEVVGPAHTLDEALALARDENIDVAVLDVRLGRETSHAVAELLVSRGIPLLVYSGQVEDTPHVRSGDAIKLSKPASRQALIGAVQKLLEHVHSGASS